MPYIDEARRDDLDMADLDAAGKECQSAGELNYCISVLVDGYLAPEPGYRDMNEAIGALECAKLEVYRRLVAPYEDVKRQENTDVFPRLQHWLMGVFDRLVGRP